MKTIDELVSEVAKNLGALKAEKPLNAEKSVSENKAEIKTQEIRQTEKKDVCRKMTLDIAKELAEAAQTAAQIIGIKIVVTVVNEGANLVLLQAMDDSYIASIKAAQDKAYTAVALKMPTHTALEESRGGALDGLTNGNGILLLGGGFPLENENKIYGGIGVSGGSKEQDTLIAAAAAEYFRLRFN